MCPKKEDPRERDSRRVIFCGGGGEGELGGQRIRYFPQAARFSIFTDRRSAILLQKHGFPSLFQI
ncbi:hypothetical protein DQG13_20305 [Paenibacillus sp. YN15]|nr:hypothetical protein DQG13_20305 [Paenibacillus sp. YN15]